MIDVMFGCHVSVSLQYSKYTKSTPICFIQIQPTSCLAPSAHCCTRSHRYCYRPRTQLLFTFIRDNPKELKMGKINGCLKCLFIFFNVISALIGCVLIYLMVKVQIYSSQLSAAGGPSLAWGWIFAIGVLGVSVLGIVAACSEKLILLKIFAAFMAIGLIIMMICGIVVAVFRNKVKDALDSASAEVAKPFMEDKEARGILEELQRSALCCGVVSFKDWNKTIPDSCDCKPASGTDFHPSGVSGYECESRPQGYSGPDKIYKQPCKDVIFAWINLIFKIMMGFFFGLAVTALLGLLVSILMICQVKRNDSGGVSSMAMKGY